MENKNESKTANMSENIPVKDHRRHFETEFALWSEDSNGFCSKVSLSVSPRADDDLIPRGETSFRLGGESPMH
jgi:hypothetical protein